MNGVVQVQNIITKYSLGSMTMLVLSSNVLAYLGDSYTPIT